MATWNHAPEEVMYVYMYMYIMMLSIVLKPKNSHAFDISDLISGILHVYYIIIHVRVGIMGQSGSSQGVVRKKGEVILQSSQPPEMLEFSTEQSQLVSYGIDYQSSPRFKHKTLTKMSGEDSRTVSETFRKTRKFIRYENAVLAT